MASGDLIGNRSLTATFSSDYDYDDYYYYFYYYLLQEGNVFALYSICLFIGLRELSDVHEAL